MMKYFYRKLGLIVFLIFIIQTGSRAQLRVSENGRYLVHSDGTPFYWLEDTGWGLFQKPDRDEVRLYFDTRAKQGFTVIHAAACHVNPFIVPSLKNVYGDKAFINDDPLQPDVIPGNDPFDSASYDYWDHIEYVIDLADEYDLYINFLPIFGMKEGEGYNFLTPDNAYEYGKFIGSRFKEKANVIWCIGGDVIVDNPAQKSVWDLLAKGVTMGVTGTEDYSKVLMTFHTRGGHSSSDFFPDSPWLDFNMLQTWDSYNRIYSFVSDDYQSEPIKPILHGEGAYEEGPEYPTKPITPFIVRKQIYWALFAGGLHTYGNTNVWSFGTNDKYLTKDWKDAITSDGAKYAGVSRTIMEQLEWWKFAPDQSVILNLGGQSDNHHVAMRSQTDNGIIVYISNSMAVDVDLTTLSDSRTVEAFWINPETGKWKKVSKVEKGSHQVFTPPNKFEDAVLLVKGAK